MKSGRAPSIGQECQLLQVKELRPGMLQASASTRGIGVGIILFVGAGVAGLIYLWQVESISKTDLLVPAGFLALLLLAGIGFCILEEALEVHGDGVVYR